MSSTTRFSWPSPILVTPDSLTAMHERLASVGRIARREFVASEGVEPEKVQSVAEAQALFEKTKEWRYERLVREIAKIDRVYWSVRLANEISRSDLSLEEVLKLPNVDGSQILELEGSAGRYDTKLEITLSSRYGSSASVIIRGNYGDVQTLQGEVKELLSSTTRNWSVVTRPVFGFLALITSMIASLVLNFLIVFKVGTARDWTSETGANWIMSTTSILCLFWLIFGQYAVRKWKAIFPMIEFYYGGGVNRVASNRAWRKAVWTLPIGFIGIPLIVNWFSDFIF